MGSLVYGFYSWFYFALMVAFWFCCFGLLWFYLASWCFCVLSVVWGGWLYWFIILFELALVVFVLVLYCCFVALWFWCVLVIVIGSGLYLRICCLLLVCFGLIWCLDLLYGFVLVFVILLFCILGWWMCLVYDFFGVLRICLLETFMLCLLRFGVR